MPRLFIVGGLAVGAAEAAYYLGEKSPLNISFALADAAAAVEKSASAGHIFNDAFVPQVNPVFLGIVAGALLVSLATIRRRRRTLYPFRVLLLAFLGGFLAGLGTVLAQGDMLFHLVGGVALLQTSSLFMAVFSIPFVFLAVEVLTALGAAGFFRVNQQFETAGGSGNEARIAGDKPEGHHSSETKPKNGRAFMLLAGSLPLAILVLLALYTRAGGFGLLPLGAGLIAGAGLAVSGFGVEWSLLVPDCAASSPDYLRKLGLSRGSAALLSGFEPVRAWLIAVAMLSLTALIVSISGGMSADAMRPLSAGAPFHLGQVAGAPLLAIGSVLMIGCDFRTYARLGMGYPTAAAALPGLLLGFLPGALWQGRLSSWMSSNVIAQSSWLPGLISPLQAVRLVIWLLFLLFLGISIVLGPRLIRRR